MSDTYVPHGKGLPFNWHYLKKINNNNNNNNITIMIMITIMITIMIMIMIIIMTTKFNVI